MPQFIPTPWLPILLFTWFIYLTIIPSKVLSHNFPNKATPLIKLDAPLKPWGWMWP